MAHTWAMQGTRIEESCPIDGPYMGHAGHHRVQAGVGNRVMARVRVRVGLGLGLQDYILVSELRGAWIGYAGTSHRTRWYRASS